VRFELSLLLHPGDASFVFVELFSEVLELLALGFPDLCGVLAARSRFTIR
jgi:hypothetical protein